VILDKWIRCESARAIHRLTRQNFKIELETGVDRQPLPLRSRRTQFFWHHLVGDDILIMLQNPCISMLSSLNNTVS
jgi:hypothetical protein